jgi:glyoxylase-like metal-dependent hydrolase (beta-lactamase superfamily II)
VVNTHFHWDHSLGNEAYLSSWPAGVEIISSEATRANLEQRGIPAGSAKSLPCPKKSNS